MTGGLLALAIVFLAGSWVLTPDPVVGGFAVSPTLLDRKGRLFHARLSVDEEWLLPVSLANMSPWLPKVAVAVEDKRFYNHKGLDFLALGRAIGQNLRPRRVISGASTIPVPVVRPSAPRERTLVNKYVVFIQAFQLAQKLDNDQILGV